MTVPQKWAIREIPVATFYDITTGKAIVQLDTLKTSGIENKGKTTYAVGGRGNAKLIGFSSDREATIKLQDAVFTQEVIAMMTGNSIVKGQKGIYQRDLITVATNAASLNFTPAHAGALIGLYKANADGTQGTELTYASGSVAAGKYTLTGKAIALNTGEVATGGQLIAYYLTDTDAATETITISADKFAGTFKVVLDCLVRDFHTQQDFAAQVVIPTAKMDQNWNINMTASGEPAVFDIPLEILRPSNSSTMYEMTIYDANQLS
ncbi:unnamed protein product [Aphanomyces euteiches]